MNIKKHIKISPTIIMKTLKMQLLLISVLFLMMPMVIAAWEPPIGIPKPEFGIEETHMMYKNARYDFGNGLESYKDAGNGPYTHYVDMDHFSSTDSNNLFGTQTKPRKTIPLNLPAGSVVEVHNGSYEYTKSNFHGDTYLPITGTGTKEKPIFIRGTDSDRFVFGSSANQVLVIDTSYMIMENVKFDGTGLKIYQPTSNFALRHSEVIGKNTSGIEIWTYKTEFSAGELKENLVFYDNTVHDCGLYPSSSETGKFGFMIDDATKNVWIVDNKIYNNGDDGIQIIDRYWVGNIGPNADRIYIGRNEMHHDGENAIDIKGSTNVIVSQNEIYGYKRIMSSSYGDAIRVNDEGNQDSIWILYNHIYDSEWGIAPYGSLDPPYIVGNLIHGCNIGILRGSQSIVNNVIYDCGEGIENGKEITNNIISKTSSPVSGGNDVRNNLLWQNSKSYSCTDCINADPLFVNPGADNFHLKEGSPAIDKGIKSGVYQTFYNRYGLDISVDFDGKSRPFGSGWDMGAYEHAGTFPTPTPIPSPTGSSDLNNDGKVDIIDLGILLSNWNSTSKPSADINQDGNVDIIDLGILLSNWG